MSKWAETTETYRTVNKDVTIISIVLGIISVVFGLISFVILVKMRFKERHIGFRVSSIFMLTNLVAADWLRGVSIFSGTVRYFIIFHTKYGPNRGDPCDADLFCRIQSFFSIWFNMIMLLCILFIGIFAVYQVAGCQEDRYIGKKVLIVTSILCWTIPFFITLIPAITGALGEDQTVTTNGWCWITSCNRTTREIRVVYMLIYSRAFDAMIFLINLTLFIYLKYITYTSNKSTNNLKICNLSISTASYLITESFGKKNIRNDSKLLFLINLSICTCRIWGIVRTGLDISLMYSVDSSIVKIVQGSSAIFMILQIIFDNIQTTFVFVVLLLCCNFVKTYLYRLICRRRLSVDRSTNF